MPGQSGILPRLIPACKDCILPNIDPHSAEYLQSRSWQGLKQRLGESEVSIAVEGTTGIAASYTHESEYNLKNTSEP